MEMVQYWKREAFCSAKITTDKSGSIIMQLEGEKYTFPTYPRSYLLYGSLSKIKHEIKNQVFNESWRKLEEGEDKEKIIKDIKDTLFNNIAELAWNMRFDMLPPESMCPSVKEIHRAWTKITNNPDHLMLRDYLCLILQEDDGYRFRVQWLAQFRWFFSIRWFSKSLDMLEHAEVTEDMKGRIRLLKRILLLVLEDKNARELFNKLFKEINWKKVKLTKGDKYHFRGKYFKVDYPVLEY